MFNHLAGAWVQFSLIFWHLCSGVLGSGIQKFSLLQWAPMVLMILKRKLPFAPGRVAKGSKRRKALRYPESLSYIIQFAYANLGFSSFASVTIFLIPSSGRLPFLNSSSTSGRRTSISFRNASSKAFTCLTGTSRSRPLVPR